MRVGVLGLRRGRGASPARRHGSTRCHASRVRRCRGAHGRTGEVGTHCRIFAQADGRLTCIPAIANADGRGRRRAFSLTGISLTVCVVRRWAPQDPLARLSGGSSRCRGGGKDLRVPAVNVGRDGRQTPSVRSAFLLYMLIASAVHAHRSGRHHRCGDRGRLMPVTDE